MLKINKIYNMDCLEGLKLLDDNSIDCCVTSPPYYGLRDYGVDGQIGLENTLEEYIKNLVIVFREVKRVLKDEGTLWLNLGDSYAGSGKVPASLKPKDLIGVPWRVAFALQENGWYLRQDIIWHKPNAMPESVKDRPTKAHEYIFLFSKSKHYYYDYEAIKEPCVNGDPNPPKGSKGVLGNMHQGRRKQDLVGKPQYTGFNARYKPREYRNKRSVWTIPTKPFKEAHFATFPEKLIEPCILAGCPVGGIVLDPFMGSGTTAQVALELQRNFVGFELNPKYIEIAGKYRLNKIQLTIV